jgi:hypothetical protein
MTDRLGDNFIKLWQNANGKMRKVASCAIIFPILYIFVHFVQKSMAKVFFQKQAAYLSFV